MEALSCIVAIERNGFVPSIKNLLNEKDTKDSLWPHFLESTWKLAGKDEGESTSFHKRKSVGEIKGEISKKCKTDETCKCETCLSARAPSPPKSMPPKAWWFMRSLDDKQRPALEASPELRLSYDRKCVPFATVTPMNWMKNYEHLKKFKQIFGNCNVPKKEGAWKSLGQWVRQQRRKKKLGKISHQQETFLEKLGFEWERGYKAASAIPCFFPVTDTLPIATSHSRTSHRLKAPSHQSSIEQPFEISKNNRSVLRSTIA